MPVNGSELVNGDSKDELDGNTATLMRTEAWSKTHVPLELVLYVRDGELRDALEERTIGNERDSYALDALRIGVLALRQASTQIDADQVRNEGERLVEQMRTALEHHRDDVRRNLTDELKLYFDPESGRFSERVKRLVERDGELERVLRHQVGQDGSTLSRTLSAHLSPESPLMKTLDAASPDGFLAGLQTTVAASLAEQEKRVLSEFSLDNKNGALSRLIDELTARHGKIGEDLAGSINDVIAEFSLDREDSALSRLVSRIERAQKKISSEFSLDAKGSALARMRAELVGVIEEVREKNESFQRDVLEQLTTIATNRRQEATSPKHGLAFERSLRDELIRQRQSSDDIVEHTGNTTGRIRACKKGDFVLTLGGDHAAAGARIVFEAKESKGYALKTALDEIEKARDNRVAGIGVFVYSVRTAPAGVAPVKRYGQDVVVTWHPDAPETAANLAAGIAIAEALSVRTAASGTSEADIVAIETAIIAIEKYCEGLEEITKSAESVRKSASKIIKRAGLMGVGLEKELTTLSAKVIEVKNHLVDQG